MEKLCFFHKIINFSSFEPLHQLQKLWCHNEYQPKVEYIFKYIFWIENHLVMKLGQIIVIVANNILKKIIVWFGGLHSRSKTFLIYYPTTINQKPNLILQLFTILKVCTETIKNSEHHLLKINRSHYFVILNQNYERASN